jgi:Methyltransferase domain/C-methyltransferase C-terminal domain
MPPISNCPNCLQESVEIFYTVDPVPVHSVMLVPTREEALHFPSGKIVLGFCNACGFITNTAFDESKMNYSPKCEETQGFSPTFQSFHSKLAKDLIERYGLRNKSVLEIGCGKGEFISMLCAMGGNRGIGFDPAFVPQRRPEEGGDAVEFIQDFYSEKYTHIKADFIACKMTLEHIPDTHHFVSMVRRAVGDSFDTTVFFQIPDMSRVLKDVAFWDVYHEHCSYFTSGALRNVFVASGFDVMDVWTDYDDQYLMITARPTKGPVGGVETMIPPTSAEISAVRSFTLEAERRIGLWQQTVKRLKQEGQHVVIWGSGSKGVSFLSALGGNVEDGGIEYAVDINPYRKGYFMPGTGQEIVEPAFLSAYRPEVVIAMNSIYTAEIEADLKRHGVHAIVMPIEAVEAAV